MPDYRYSHDELMALWEQAGGPAVHADTAAAIARAESGGCRFALAGPFDVRPVKVCVYRKTDKENSFGLWQINLMAHPQYHAPGIFDALSNARAAVAISNHGLSFVPWSTYGNGAYEKYLSGGVPGVTAGPTSGQTRPPQTLGGWHDFTGALATRFPSRLASARSLVRHANRNLAARRRS